MMLISDWYERAIVFDLGTCIFYNRPIKIEARDQPNFIRLWVLKMDEWVLGKDGKFHFEPTPSVRTAEFINLTRFKDPNLLHTFWSKAIHKAEPLLIESPINVEQNIETPPICHCGGECIRSTGIVNEWVGTSEWADGDMAGATLGTSSEGTLVNCWKCRDCGHSFT